MEIIIWIVVGVIVGWTGFLFMRTPLASGAVPDISGGIVGALLGGWLASYFSQAQSGISWFDFYSFFGAIIGAIAVIAIARAMR